MNKLKDFWKRLNNNVISNVEKYIIIGLVIVNMILAFLIGLQY